MTREQLHATQRDAEKALRTVRVPIERKVAAGFVFATSDRTVYLRTTERGPMRRAIPKARGKAARRADKQARRT